MNNATATESTRHRRAVRSASVLKPSAHDLAHARTVPVVLFVSEETAARLEAGAFVGDLESTTRARRLGSAMRNATQFAELVAGNMREGDLLTLRVLAAKKSAKVDRVTRAARV